MKPLVQLISAIVCIPGLACAETKPERPKPASIPVYSPARQPVVTGEVPVGLIVVTFKETALPNDFTGAMGSLDKIAGISQEEYFKIYSNGIAWPKVHVMPAEGINYKAPQFYGYYCEYDYWKNPLGWKTLEEGNKRANRMKNDALQFASKNYRGPKPRFICHNYVTIHPDKAAKEITDELLKCYETNRSGNPAPRRPRPVRKTNAKDQAASTFDPWAYLSLIHI